MLASDHNSLVAFDAAVETAFHAAGDLGSLIRHDSDRYVALAAMVTAVADAQPDRIRERLSSDFQMLAGEETAAPHERSATESEGPADLDRAKHALLAALADRGLEAADSERIADAVIGAARDLLGTVGPVTGAGPEPTEQRDPTYGLP